MATIKLKFRSSSVSTKDGTLYFQLIHRRVVRQINTKYRLSVAEWEVFKAGDAALTVTDSKRRQCLDAMGTEIGYVRNTLESIILRLEQTGMLYSADDIVAAYARKVKAGGFLSFLRKHIAHLVKSGRLSAARKARITLNSFSSFLDSDDIAFERMDGNLLEEYEGWLKRRNVCMNTSSFYMRTLRAVYNIAVERNLTEQQHPFRHVYTGMDKTVKRALPLGIIRKIRNLDLSLCPALDFARNIFLLSFYLRGMSFVDMCFLKKKDLAGGILSYRRQKTGQLLQVKWEKPMQELLDLLGESDTDYLFPLIADATGNEWKQYENALRKVNRNLKKVGRMAGLETALTTYVARHSWASVAKSHHIPITTISEGLGHDSVSTTKIYLASLDTSVVDHANRKILRLLE